MTSGDSGCHPVKGLTRTTQICAACSDEFFRPPDAPVNVINARLWVFRLCGYGLKLLESLCIIEFLFHLHFRIKILRSAQDDKVTFSISHFSVPSAKSIDTLSPALLPDTPFITRPPASSARA